MTSSPGARIFRRIVMGVALTVAIGYPLLFLYLQRQGNSRPDLLFDAVLAAIIVVFLSYASRVRAAMPNACPSCAGRLRRTRSSAGLRFWTCSACGYERTRIRPRPTVVPETQSGKAFSPNPPLS